jgi:tetratricopeptide (TPR) repeat protein
LNNDANSNDNKKALIIAVSDYDNSSNLKSIHFCKNDGTEIYTILKKNGYDIPDHRKLIGYVDYQSLKNAIYDFFTNEDNKPDDILVFYYSGHGIPDKWGTTFLAPSNIDSDRPFMTGFSFDDLTNSMLTSNSLRVVTILDSCFSGSLKISKSKGLDSKSGEEAATIIANNMIDEKSDKLKQGVGRCLLASSQGYEEAYNRQEKDHSIFTYYLLEGLKGHKNAVDDEGNVTYDTLGKFISREIGNLPSEKRPKQTPIRKGEVSGGDIILAKYPNLRKTKESDYYALFGRGEDYYRQGQYPEALKCYDLILNIQPNNEFALLRKGNILVNINEDTKAIECFDHLIQINDNNLDAWYYKAQIHIKIRDYENALKCLEEASNINPADERIWEGFKRVKSLKLSSRQKEKQDYIMSQENEIQKKNRSKVDNVNDNGESSKQNIVEGTQFIHDDKITSPKIEEEEEKSKYTGKDSSEHGQGIFGFDSKTIDNTKTTTIISTKSNVDELQPEKDTILQPPKERTGGVEDAKSSRMQSIFPNYTEAQSNNDNDGKYTENGSSKRYGAIIESSSSIPKDTSIRHIRDKNTTPTNLTKQDNESLKPQESENQGPPISYIDPDDKLPDKVKGYQGEEKSNNNLKIIIPLIAVVVIIGLVFALNFWSSSTNDLSSSTNDLSLSSEGIKCITYNIGNPDSTEDRLFDYTKDQYEYRTFQQVSNALVNGEIKEYGLRDILKDAYEGGGGTSEQQEINNVVNCMKESGIL